MSAALLSWFPSRAYANLFGIVVLLVLLSDELIPRLIGGKRLSVAPAPDRGSFLTISAAAVLGLAAGFYCRYHNIGVVPFGVQVFALIVVLAGAVLREWAIILLGRFFSRTVQVESTQRLIQAGPYRWIRHPAYTGMLMTDVAIVLGFGTWVGAVAMFGLLLLAVRYRIGVEEHALLQAFGEEYRVYMQHTARLFPPW
jgi:protein-S-isoprenylcysteine O-methyltransferase Ste14